MTGMTGQPEDPYVAVMPPVAAEPRNRRGRTAVLWVVGVVAALALCLLAVGAGFAYLLMPHEDVAEAVGDPILSVAPPGSSQVDTTEGYDLDEPMRFAGVILRPDSTTTDALMAEVADAALAAGWTQIQPDGGTRDGCLCFVRSDNGTPSRVLDLGPYDGTDKVGQPGDVAVVVSTWTPSFFGPSPSDAPCAYASAFNGEWHPAPSLIGTDTE